MGRPRSRAVAYGNGSVQIITQETTGTYSAGRDTYCCIARLPRRHSNRLQTRNYPARYGV